MSYLSIRVEGGLLSPDFLERIHEAQGQKPADFGLDSHRSIVDEVSAVWGDTRAYWDAFQRRVARAKSGRSESLTTITREQWIIPLLEALNYTVSFQRHASEVDGRTYAISHRAGEDESAPPVHIVSKEQQLGEKPASGRGSMSPHALLQDYLNRSDDHLWGIVTNGEILRMLRDSTYFSRPSYIEFDLRQMLEGERLDEFFLLFRLVHRNRLPLPDETPSDCLLESYYQDTLEQGGRIRDGLREAVSEAIITLANGFLGHPRNMTLRERLQSDQLTEEELYRQLLYLIYRFLFLMVAEERNLLGLDGKATSDDYYRRFFSISRLRQLADEPLSAPQRFDDLYLGLRTLFRAFHDEKLAAQLDVPPLNGELFAELADLDNAHLTNRDLLQAIRLMSYFTPKDEKVRRRVNYGALDVEELGSVYESLLEEHPFIVEEAGNLTFGFVSGTERRTTGSYYTPRELVVELIKSALVPVLTKRLEKAGKSTNAREQALLTLDVCDPSCGSGHFLLAAARRIGFELASVRARDAEPSPRMIRKGTRDAIIHCIYGVDKNPLAVDLCKVALWIEGHSTGMPLTFLDYRIRCGDSLVGVFDLEILKEGIPNDAYKAATGDEKTVATALKKQNKQERVGQMSLLHGLGAPETTMNNAAWQMLGEMPEDTPQQVQAKAHVYQQLQSEMEQLEKACNLWTAAFFVSLTKASVSDGQVPTTDSLRRYLNSQPVNGRLVGNAQGLSRNYRFFHWQLAYPHVFSHGGFDVVLGNPPWERVKLDETEWFAPRRPDIASIKNKSARSKKIEALNETDPNLYSEFLEAKAKAENDSLFLRVSGRYPLAGRGDVNTYQVFAELASVLRSNDGRAGIIVPTGIATAYYTQEFFRSLVEKQSLASFYGFINSKKIFTAIKDYIQFALVTLGHEEHTFFSFMLTELTQLQESARTFAIARDEIRLVNPNTLTCPVFRTRADAELTKKIYRSAPVLLNHDAGNNRWGITTRRIFDMNRVDVLNLCVTEPHANTVPMYEGKILFNYDHRFSTYENATEANLNERNLPQFTEEMHSDPLHLILPRYWIAEHEVTHKVEEFWDKEWLVGYRDITGNAAERTAIFSVIPLAGSDFTIRLAFLQLSNMHIACFIGCVNSLVFDFVSRQKLNGSHLSDYIFEQLPVLTPEVFDTDHMAFIVPRVFELVYTAWDVRSFARDVWLDLDQMLRAKILAQHDLNRQATGGHLPDDQYPTAPIPPFKWEGERRSKLRAELDAYYARLYGLSRTEVGYILDPTDIYGPDFPSETFRVLKEKEIKAYGEYRTQRLVLEAWDAQQAAIDSGEMPWDHPDPGPSVVGPTAIHAPSIINVGRGAAAGDTTSHSKEAAAPAASPSDQQYSPSSHPSPVTSPSNDPGSSDQPTPSQAPLIQVPLPDLSLASEGTFSQRLKRVQKLSKNPSPAEIAELTVYLAARESSLRWLASSTLSKIGDPQVEAAINALLAMDIGDAVREEAEKILSTLVDPKA